MTRILFVLVSGIVLNSCVRTPIVTEESAEPRKTGASIAVAIEDQFRQLASLDEGKKPLWPGFDPLAVPLAVFDGERTFLFRHPDAPPGFSPAPDQTRVYYVLEGRHEAVTANTSAELGGVPTATLLLDGPQPTRSLASVAAMAVHETFHVFQRAHHPAWAGNEADLFTYPIDDAELLALRRLETEALRRALVAETAVDAACWARTALALRGERHAQMDPAFATYESATELNEGLATYVEMRAEGRSTPYWPEAGFGPADIRSRSYATGSALALLLDRYMPGWQVKFETDDSQVLETALATALGPGKTCTFSNAFEAEAEARARTDAGTLVAERARRLTEFNNKPGWRVVVEVGEGEPLWPQGFDPLNVERVDSMRVLHTRFLRLGNSAGQLEVLNAEALTEGVEAHPLYQGIRRLLVTGLVEPEVSDVQGRVTLRAPGLAMEFSGASLVREDMFVTVRLDSLAD